MRPESPAREADPREDRLPVWAARRIKELRRLLVEAEADRDAARLATNPDTSTAILDPYAPIPIGLSDGHVRFILGDRHRNCWVDARVVIDRDDRYLQIVAGSGLALEPRASNVIHVRLDAS